MKQQLKGMFMSAAELRDQVHQLIDGLDENFLKVVHSMLDTYSKVQEVKAEPIVGYEVDGTPIYASAAKEEYARRVKAMKDGQSTSIEALKKEAAQW